MPKFDDLIKEHGRQIVDEAKEYAGTLNHDIPRDPVRRPWNGLDEGYEFVSESSKAGFWHSWKPLIATIARRPKTALTIFIVNLIVIVGLAQFEPYVYTSNLQLYAPQTMDTISSRLNMFSNRIEFASFPVDTKIPLALIARRLRLPAAKKWVIEEYKKHSHNTGVDIEPSTVSAESFYAEGSELMVINGSGNDPQIAADITNLYWDYLENEIQKMRLDHAAKMTNWMELTDANLNQHMRALALEIEQISMAHTGEAKSQVHAKLAETYAELEMKRLSAIKERDEFRAALAGEPGEKIWLVSNPEIQELRQIDEALKKQNADAPNPDISAKRKDLYARAFELAKNLLADKGREIASIEGQTQKMKSQLSLYQGSDEASPQALRLKELLRQQAEYQAQADELEHLKSQLTVESTMLHARLHAVQPAFPDPSSVRPRPVLKYAVCFVMALFLCLLILAWFDHGMALFRPREKFRQPIVEQQKVSQQPPPPNRDRGLEL